MCRAPSSAPPRPPPTGANGRRRRGKPHHEQVRTGTSDRGALVCNGIRNANPAGRDEKIF
jgi:hypothetical protein